MMKDDAGRSLGPGGTRPRRFPEIRVEGPSGISPARGGGTPTPYAAVELERTRGALVSARAALRTEEADRRQVERDLRASEARFRRFVEAANEGIVQVDARARIEYVNDRACELLGRGAEGLIGRDYRDFATAEDRAAAQVHFERRRRGEREQYEFRFVRGDGSDLWVIVCATPLQDDEGRFVGSLAMLTDIGPRRGTEEQVRRLNDALRRRLGRVAALRGIDASITAGHDLTRTLGEVVDQAVRQLGADAAAVRLGSGSGQPYGVLASRGLRVDEAGSPDLADFACCRAAALVVKGRFRGVLEVFGRAALPDDPEWSEFLETLADQAAIAVGNAALLEGLRRTNEELAAAYDATIEGWSFALDLRDKETEGHSRRVTEMTLRLARALGLTEAELVHVRRGALLHDIGKMGIPDAILLKPGPLTDAEWEVMRRHPTYALEMLAPIAFLRPALEIPYCHHEKWDGRGYPRGLRGEEIPLPARAFAAVDVWDALSHDRPYRKAWPPAEVRAHIAALAGTHLDPRVVETFLTLLDEDAAATDPAATPDTPGGVGPQGDGRREAESRPDRPQTEPR